MKKKTEKNIKGLKKRVKMREEAKKGKERKIEKETDSEKGQKERERQRGQQREKTKTGVGRNTEHSLCCVHEAGLGTNSGPVCKSILRCSLLHASRLNTVFVLPVCTVTPGPGNALSPRL